jgi:hypothetical protein
MHHEIDNPENENFNTKRSKLKKIVDVAGTTAIFGGGAAITVASIYFGLRTQKMNLETAKLTLEAAKANLPSE